MFESARLSESVRDVRIIPNVTVLPETRIVRKVAIAWRNLRQSSLVTATVRQKGRNSEIGRVIQGIKSSGRLRLNSGGPLQEADTSPVGKVHVAAEFAGVRTRL